MKKQFYQVKKVLLLLFVAFAATDNNLQGQVSVVGPVCVMPGITYHYTITGNRDAASTMRICITGGILNTGQTCTPDSAIINSVFVIWDDTGSHKLEVTSSVGNVSLSVMHTNVLQGGSINASDKSKVYDSTVATYTFHCGLPNGGSCSPNYMYQWQKSTNGMGWVNISGSTGQDLQFSGSISRNTFFRRITTETKSNTIAYSDWATLSIPVN